MITRTKYNYPICFECNSKATEKHHVIPKTKGGTKTVWLCSICHGKVHNMKRLDIRVLTKEALNAKRIREPEYKFGTPANLTPEAILKAHASTSYKARNDMSIRHAYHYIAPLKEAGHTLQSIADKLNAEGYKTRTGKSFHPGQVLRILNRFTIVI